MADGLDLGTAEGRVVIVDGATSVLNTIGGAVEKVADSWKNAGATIVEGAASFFTAQAALNAVEGAAKLAVSAVEELTMGGAAASDVQENFEHLTGAAGRLSSTLLGALQEGTHNTVDNFTLMQTANKDLSAGLNLTDDQFKTVASGAFALAQATGTDVKDALDTMNDALLTGRVRALGVMSVHVDLEKAQKDYAASIGLTSDMLTDEEKLQATRIATLQAIADHTKNLGEQTDGMDEKVQQAETAWKNFQTTLGIQVANSKVLNEGIDATRDALAGAFGGKQKDLVNAVSDAINDLAIEAVEGSKTIVSAGSEVGQMWNGAKVVFGDIAQVVSGDVLAFKLLAEGIAEVGAFLQLPGAADSVNRLDGEIAKLEASMAQRGKDLLADKANEDAWAAGGQKMVDALDGIEKRMIQARADLLAHRQATDDSAASEGKAKIATDAAAAALAAQAAQVRLTNDQIKQYNAAWVELTSVGTTYLDTIKGIDGTTAEAVKYYLDAGVSQKTLATAYQLTAEQVKALDTERQAEIEGLKEEMKTSEAAAQAMDEYNKVRLSDQQTMLGIAEKNDEAYYAKLLSEGKVTEQQYSAYILADREQLGRQNEAIYKQQTQDEIDALNRKQADELKSLDQQLAQQKIDYADYVKSKENIDDEYSSKRDTLEEQYTAASKQRAQSVQESLAAVGTEGQQSFQLISEGAAIAGTDIDNLNKKTLTLDGTLMDAVKFKQMMDQGTSYDVTSANFASSMSSILTSNGWNPAGMGAQQYRDPYQLAKAGYSFEEVMKYAFDKSQQGGPLPPPQGPRIPGFRDGGIGDFGDGTLAMLHGKEAIVPLDKQGALGGNINLTFHVNGTGAQAAAQIKDIVLRQLQSQRQF